jgi:hypothetical protein
MTLAVETGTRKDERTLGELRFLFRGIERHCAGESYVKFDLFFKISKQYEGANRNNSLPRV